MKKGWIALAAAALLILGGCSSKRYFEPQEVVGEVEFDGELPASIVDVLRDGATLENGMFISRDGLEDYTMPKDWLFLNKAEGKYIVASRCGKLQVVDSVSKRPIYEKSFSMRSPTAANLKGPLLALVFDDNSLMLIDMPSDRILFEIKKPSAIANDTKIANPFFLTRLVIFPTLDGKLSIVDPASGREIRTLVAGTHDYFNNVIYLNVIDDILVAATPNKIIAVSPHYTSSLDVEISDVIYVEGRVYILTKDGRVILTDPSLNVLKTRKFPFAHFTGAIWGEYIYLIEKEGYIIALDKDLRSANVFEFPTEVEEYIFTAKDKVYYDDKYFELNTSK